VFHREVAVLLQVQQAADVGGDDTPATGLFQPFGLAPAEVAVSG